MLVATLLFAGGTQFPGPDVRLRIRGWGASFELTKTSELDFGLARDPPCSEEGGG